MGEVKFNLKNRLEKRTLVYLFFRYNGRRFKYSTGEKIEPENWNEEKQRAEKGAPAAFEFNTMLDNLENEVKNIYRRFKNDGKTPTVNEMRAELDERTRKAGKKNTVPTHLMPYIENFIDQRRLQPQYSQRTIEGYSHSYEILKEYAKVKNKTIDFADVTLHFYFDLLEHLHNKKRFSTNSAGKVIKFLKTVLNIATEQGVNKNLAFKGRHFKKPTEDSENIYLSVSEITQIHQHEIKESSRLARVKDLFVVGCFTGLRFGDLSTLKPENICHLYNAKEGETIEAISLTTQKTKERVTIPIHPFVREILQKYEGKLPKSPHRNDVNKLIKVIARKAGITHQMEVTRNEAGKQVKVIREKCELITTHTARRSFATNTLKSGMEAISIMKITGHRSEKAFLSYIKITAEENAVLVAGNKFWKNEKQTSNLKAI